jgi:hypothetical protein
MNTEIATKQYTQSELSLANDNSLNAKQLQLLLKRWSVVGFSICFSIQQSKGV